MGTVSNSSFQKFNSDDDLLVTCFSNDEDTKRLSTEESIRVFWETKLPTRLDFSKEDWEVALVNFSCRNRERLDVQLVVTKSDDVNYVNYFISHNVHSRPIFYKSNLRMSIGWLQPLVKEIEHLYSCNNLIDIWRQLNPQLESFTWRNKSHKIQCTLDFFLISSSRPRHVL